jgi:hypothetical protein
VYFSCSCPSILSISVTCRSTSNNQGLATTSRPKRSFPTQLKEAMSTVSKLTLTIVCIIVVLHVYTVTLSGPGSVSVYAKQVNTDDKDSTANLSPFAVPKHGGLCNPRPEHELPSLVSKTYSLAHEGASKNRVYFSAKGELLSAPDGLLDQEIRVWVKEFISDDCVKQGLCRTIKRESNDIVVMPLSEFGYDVDLPGKEFQCHGTDARVWGDSKREEGIHASPKDSAHVTASYDLKFFEHSQLSYLPKEGYCDVSRNYVCKVNTGPMYSTPVTAEVTKETPEGTMTYEDRCHDSAINQDIACWNNKTEEWQDCGTDSASLVRTRVQWAVTNAVISGSYTDDLFVEFYINPATRQLFWSVCVDSYPYFEAYIQVGDEAPTRIFQIQPRGNDTPASSEGRAHRSFEGFIVF